MKCLNRFLSIALVMIVMTVTSPPQATSATVDSIPQRVVTQYINLTLRDSKELLALVGKVIAIGDSSLNGQQHE